jgi:hypothetical protein
LLDAHQLAHAHPSGSSADIIAGQILPFAPEPLHLRERHRVKPSDWINAPTSFAMPGAATLWWDGQGY